MLVRAMVAILFCMLGGSVKYNVALHPHKIKIVHTTCKL